MPIRCLLIGDPKLRVVEAIHELEGDRASARLLALADLDALRMARPLRHLHLDDGWLLIIVTDHRGRLFEVLPIYKGKYLTELLESRAD